jgi:steroid delta-isomerase-like uncharacterized protein
MVPCAAFANALLNATNAENCGGKSMEQYKAIVRRYYDEVWCKGNVALVDELMSTTYQNIDPATPGGCLKGREAFKGLVRTYREAMPDFRMEVVQQWSEGDTVITRWRASGTQTGALMGIAPTGKRPRPIDGVTLTKFVEGRIVEDWAVWDQAGLLRELGVLPA